MDETLVAGTVVGTPAYLATRPFKCTAVSNGPERGWSIEASCNGLLQSGVELRSLLSLSSAASCAEVGVILLTLPNIAMAQPGVWRVPACRSKSNNVILGDTRRSPISKHPRFSPNFRCGAILSMS